MAFQKASANYTTKTEPVRLAFPKLFEPQAILINGQPQGDPRFSAMAVIPKTSPIIAEIKQIITGIAQQSFPQQGIATPGMHLPLIDPAQHSKHSQDANYTDCMLLSMSAKQNSPPQVLKRINGQFVALDPNTERALVYSGMEAYLAVGFFTYFTSSTSFGVGCALNMVLITGRDVGRFDGRATADSAFGDIAGADFHGLAPPPAPGAPVGQNPFGGAPAAPPAAPPAANPFGDAAPAQAAQPSPTENPFGAPPGIAGNANPPW